ncbi:TPA: RNA polymerase sigma factor [Streptococcus suis]
MQNEITSVVEEKRDKKIADVVVQLKKVEKKLINTGEQWFKDEEFQELCDRLEHLQSQELENQARNKRNDSKKYGPEISLDFPLDDKTTVGDVLLVPQLTPEDLVIRSDALQKLEEAMNKLDDTTKKIVEYYHLDNLSMREIARQLGITHRTVSVKLQKGIEQLRNNLDMSFF